nr:hypothetical protein [Haloferax sp. ATB1]
MERDGRREVGCWLVSKNVAISGSPSLARVVDRVAKPALRPRTEALHHVFVSPVIRRRTSVKLSSPRFSSRSRSDASSVSEIVFVL